MGIEEILKIENNRTNDNFDKIYLFLDNGGPWYKAYEWSAYLMEFYPENTGDKLKPTKRTYKGVKTDLVHVSIQLKSIDKYLPGKIIVEQNEGIIVLSVDPKKYIDNNKENFLDKLKTWKNTIELSTKSDKSSANREQNNIFGSPASFFKIMKRIMVYDTYGKTEADLRDFILILKENCSNIIF